jgi:hypothetical protein
MLSAEAAVSRPSRVLSLLRSISEHRPCRISRRRRSARRPGPSSRSSSVAAVIPAATGLLLPLIR